MGSVISKAANGVGALIGNAFVAPFKTVFGGSCEGVCSGTWDITCFIEHLCVSDLVKLLMVLGLCYITLMFFYLMFKVGIFQCIGRSLCKMCWAACETYWFALEDITCFLWHKLKNTKRVNRRHRRFRDIEVGYSSSDENDSLGNYPILNVGRKRKSVRDRRKHQLRSSLYPLRQSYKHGYGNHSRHSRHVRLKTRQLSVQVKGGSRRARNSRRLQIRKVSNAAILFKRRRFR